MRIDAEFPSQEQCHKKKNGDLIWRTTIKWKMSKSATQGLVAYWYAVDWFSKSNSSTQLDSLSWNAPRPNHKQAIIWFERTSWMMIFSMLYWIFAMREVSCSWMDWITVPIRTARPKRSSLRNRRLLAVRDKRATPAELGSRARMVQSRLTRAKSKRNQLVP